MLQEKFYTFEMLEKCSQGPSYQINLTSLQLSLYHIHNLIFSKYDNKYPSVDKLQRFSCLRFHMSVQKMSLHQIPVRGQRSKQQCI